MDVLVYKLILLVLTTITTLLWAFLGAGPFTTRGPTCLNLLLVYMVGFPGIRKPFETANNTIVFILQYFPLGFYGFFLSITYYINFQLLIGYILGILLIILTASIGHLKKFIKKQRLKRKSHQVAPVTEVTNDESFENEVRFVRFVPPIRCKPPTVIHQVVTADVHRSQEDEVEIRRKYLSRPSSWFRPASPIAFFTSLFGGFKSEDADTRSTGTTQKDEESPRPVKPKIDIDFDEINIV